MYDLYIFIEDVYTDLSIFSDHPAAGHFPAVVAAGDGAHAVPAAVGRTASGHAAAPPARCGHGQECCGQDSHPHDTLHPGRFSCSFHGSGGGGGLMANCY